MWQPLKDDDKFQIPSADGTLLPTPPISPRTNADFVIQKKIARESRCLQSVVCTSFHLQQLRTAALVSRDEVLFIPYSHFLHFVFRLGSGGFCFAHFAVDYYFYYSDFYLSFPSQLTSRVCRVPSVPRERRATVVRVKSQNHHNTV